MKKLLAVILAAAIVLGLVGCSGAADVGNAGSSSEAGPGSQTQTQTETEAQTPVETQEITLKLSFNGDFTTMAEAVVGAAERVSERYAREGKGIRVAVEVDYQTIDNSEFHNNIVFAHKSGDAPDIFACDADIPGYVGAGVVLDITDIMTDAMVENITRPATVDGKVYAMPFDLPLRVVYYNHNDLKAIGWTDDEIAALPQDIASGKVTFEDFIALCKDVVAKGGATYGLVHRPSAGNDFYDLLNAVGGEYYDENGKLVFDEAGIKRMFDLLYDNAQVSKITPENLNQMGWDTINKMVGTGEAFAYFGPMFSATYVANAAGLDNDAFAAQESFVLFPKSENSDAAFCTAAPQFMAISADTKYPELCKELFLELQNGSADLMAHHSATTFSLPSVKAANSMPEITESAILAPVTYMADYAQSVPAVANATALRSLIFDQIVSLELGQTTPEKAIADLKTQAQLNIDDLIIK